MERITKKALTMARAVIANDLENLLDGFTLGGSFGRERGNKPSKDGLVYAKPYQAALKAIDAALSSQ